MKTSPLELSFWNVSINDPFWNYWISINNGSAIFHQWDQLEKTQCIDNFRITAGLVDKFREGWFFSDSDAYKWLDAAARIHKVQPNPDLLEKIQLLLSLIKQSQCSDGYLNTYNQLHFNGKKWNNLWIEHELYCLGHLIEAIISVYELTNDSDDLAIATKAGDLIVQEFMEGDGNRIPGHQEIEIALLKLYLITTKEEYLKLAQSFLERRGDLHGIGCKLFVQYQSAKNRGKTVKKLRQEYSKSHPEAKFVEFPKHVHPTYPKGTFFRWLSLMMSGKYQQQHKLLKDQLTPEGHAVRFTYTQTAIAHLHQLVPHPSLFTASQIVWDHMVQKRMFVTGGLGSLPFIEGFGRDYELSSEYGYCETCAAIGSLLWNWHMHLATQHPKYAELSEWQLYNSVLGGVALDGKSYLYCNPPMSNGGFQRESWYEVPCCPSNLSRTIAELGKYIYSISSSEDKCALYINQYIGNSTEILLGNTPIKLRIHSDLPWKSTVMIHVDPKRLVDFSLFIRIPGWTVDPTINVNGKLIKSPVSHSSIQTASGYNPYKGNYLKISRTWSAEDTIQLSFPMCVGVLKAHEKVKANKGKIALTRGPLIYCVESIDNPGEEVFYMTIDPTQEFTLENSKINDHDVVKIIGRTKNGSLFTAIPFYCWGNRGKSKMTVWIRAV